MKRMVLIAVVLGMAAMMAMPEGAPAQCRAASRLQDMYNLCQSQPHTSNVGCYAVGNIANCGNMWLRCTYVCNNEMTNQTAAQKADCVAGCNYVFGLQ